MKLFFLALIFSLALAGLASAQDFLSRGPVLLAANSDGNGPGGPPPGHSDDANATRPAGPGGQSGQDGRMGGPGGQGGPDADNATRRQGPGQPPSGDTPRGGQGRPGQGGPGGPPPGFAGGSGGQGGQGHGQRPDQAALASACAGKGAGDQCCSDDPRGGQICGECAKARQGDGLECRPRRK